MSRCFPYPPPGYTLSRAKIEAMAESIKLQKEKERKKEKSRQKKEKRKEREEDKEQKKEKRKEREERKEQKKEKRKEGDERKEQKKEKTNRNLETVNGYIGQESCLDTKNEFFHEKRETETQRLEGSSLTEEYAHPVNLHLPSSSADSTENSHKRKKDTSTTDGNHGKVILIRLLSKKQKEFDALAKEQQQPLVSVSKGTDFKDDAGLRDRPDNFSCTLKGTKEIGQESTLKTNRGNICSKSGQIEAVASRKSGTKLHDAVMTSMQEMELLYKDLLEDSFPPSPEDACFYPDNLDWLRNEDTRSEKRRRIIDDGISCSRSSSLWPRAEYLHEVDVYALPFTVPY